MIIYKTSMMICMRFKRWWETLLSLFILYKAYFFSLSFYLLFKEIKTSFFSSYKVFFSLSEMTRFYIPKTCFLAPSNGRIRPNSIGSLVLHFRCTPNEKQLLNIDSQSLQMSKIQRCNKMLCSVDVVRRRLGD